MAIAIIATGLTALAVGLAGAVYLPAPVTALFVAMVIACGACCWSMGGASAYRHMRELAAEAPAVPFADRYEDVGAEAIWQAWNTGETVASAVGPCQTCGQVRMVAKQGGKYVCAGCRR